MAARENDILDTGPLVALLIGNDAHHPWARRIWGELQPPLLTCESVLSEAQFLLARFGGSPSVVLELIPRGAIRVAFDLQGNIKRILQLQESYENVPMSLADACLVCMSEQFPRSRVVTTDSDFRLYRRNKRQQIPVLMPE